MKQSLLFLGGFLLQLNALFAQYENVWAFGKNAGLDFNSGVPVAIKTGLDGGNFLEACASVCGENGRLLFYTDGSRIWDSTHTLMPNGTDITGIVSTFSATGSTSQGALIIPAPDSTGKYYLFSLADYQKNGKLYYSIIDMSLNGGLGDVAPGRKGIYLDSVLTEKMTAVVGDRCNIWLLVNSRASEIKAYDISASGINLTPVVSQGAGLGSGLSLEPAGGIAVSPDRKKFAATKMGNVSSPVTVELYDFDPATGIVSNPVPLIFSIPAFSVCFSPDNSKLYVSTTNPANIYQFDLSSGDTALIRASQTTIGAVPFATQLKLGPDNKIYFFQVTPSGTLGRINVPDAAGTACQYTLNAVSILTGTTKGYGFPNTVPVLKYGQMVGNSHTLTGCAGDNIVLTADSVTGWDYIWNDGYTDTVHTINASGVHWVQYHMPPCVLHVDTFIIELEELAPVISVDEFDLSTTLPYSSYQWFLNGNGIPGAVDRIYSVTANGDYTVVVTNENGCTDTSDTYTVKNVTGIQPTMIAQQIRLYPNPVRDIIYIQSPVKLNAFITSIEGKQLKKIRDARTIPVSELSPGLYLIHITENDGKLLKVEKFVKAP